MPTTTKKLKINLSTFDLVKGLGMLTIIVVHMLMYYDLSIYPWSAPLYAWRTFSSSIILPMFVFISGYSFKPKGVGVILKKTLGEMIKPYLWVTLFFALLFPVCQYINYHNWSAVLMADLRYVLAYLLGISESGKVVFGLELYHCSVVWFLLALFWALNFLNLILKVKWEWVQIALVLVCQFVGMWLSAIGFTYFCIAKGFLAVIYCYAGFFLKKHNFFTKVNIHVIALLAVLCGLLIGLQIKFNLMSLTCTLATALFLPFCGVYISRFNPKGFEWLKQLGTYSYWIMCIHCVEINCIPWPRWAGFMAHNPLLAFAVDACVKAVILVGGCTVLKKIMKLKYNRRKVTHGK